MRSVCQTFFVVMMVASLLGAQDNLLGMKSIGSRSAANGQLVVIMSGRTQIAPNAEEQQDGTVKHRYVEGSGLANSALPETNTRVTILELEKEVAIPGTNKKVQGPTLLVSAAKPDERLEFLERGSKLVPLVFAPGAEIAILL